MYGTTTVNNLEIIGNITYQGHMLTYLGLSSSSPVFVNTGISYWDWLFVSIIIIFMLSFLVWGYLWSPFKTKK